MIELSCPIIEDHILHIVNFCLITGYLLIRRKFAQVISIPKTKHVASLSLSKILEKVMN